MYYSLGLKLTNRTVLAFLIMCSIPESVNLNQSLRKGQSRLRCVACEEMCTALLIPSAIIPLQPAEKTNDVSPDFPVTKKPRYASQ